MTKFKYYSLILLFAIISSYIITPNVFAEHEASVAGEVIPLADASLGHGKNCDDVHYHGELNGKPDPAPEGCGHGIITILLHDENDESIVEATLVDDKIKKPGVWNKIWNVLGDAVDVVAQMFGAPPPKTISDSVDIVEDASESIKENIDTIKEYRESVPEDEDTLGIYDTSTEGLEKDSLAKKFFDWVNSIGK